MYSGQLNNEVTRNLIKMKETLQDKNNNFSQLFLSEKNNAENAHATFRHLVVFFKLKSNI